MIKTNIQYYASNNELPKAVLKRLQPLDYQCQKYNIGEEIKAPIFLLFSPLWHHKHFIASETIWKTYLEKTYRNIKFVVVGTKEEQQSNYIDILRLPDDFEAFFRTAKPAKEAWTPISMDGLDMTEKLKRFLEGHGEDSITKILTPITMDLTIINGNLQNDKVFDETWEALAIPNQLVEKWLIFSNRFSNYYPFFSCLPFFHFFEEINLLIQQLSPFFQSKKPNRLLFQNFDCYEKTKKIKTLINVIENYV